MSDTYTPSLRISQQAIGANENSWGTILNASLAMLEEAIAGRVAIALSGNVTLTTADNADDQARNALIDFTGAPGATCTVTMPDVEKLTWVRNDTGDSSGVVIKTGAGASVAVAAGAVALIATDAAGNATAVVNVTATGVTLLADADATAMRATLGLGNIATHATTDFLAAANLTTHGVLIGNGTGPLDADTRRDIGTAAVKRWRQRRS